MSRKVLFVFNPFSGKGLIKDHLLAIVDTMVKADCEVVIYPTQYSGDACRKVQAEAADYDLVVCSGGDGTLDEVVTGLNRSGADVPIGYIPAGSTNDYANSLGIPSVMEEAARIAVSGEEFRSDVGSFNDDTFVYVAAFGLFTEVSYSTPQNMKNMLGHAAYILEGAKHLMDIPAYIMQVEHDGHIFQDKFIYGMISNSESVGGFKGITGPDVSLNDGLLEVTLIRMPSNPIELSDVISYLTGLTSDSDMVYSFKTDHIRITSRGKVAWTLDGEFGGDHEEVNIKTMKEMLRIMVSPDKN